MGNFRLAHSANMDDVDLKMREAKTALEDVSRDFRERRQRWQQIEYITNINFTAIIENESRAGSMRKNASSGSLMSLNTGGRVSSFASSVLSNNNNSSSGSLKEEDEGDESEDGGKTDGNRDDE